jgi:phosphatidylserine/phosphatidylglycerophosphate/cardiolipin synthase-like enzyme
MTATQNHSIVPVSLSTRTGTGSAQWLLEQKEDAKTPVFHQNNLHVYICGEETFRQIALDIQNARHSIDIICWGFDPAMELTRDKADHWPRGDTWGDLLRDAARGRFSGGKPVQVRLLVWQDAIGTPMVNNMPGYKSESLHERSQSVLLIPSTPSAQDRREIFNSHWYRDVAAGQIEHLALRTRGGVRADVMASLKAEAGSRTMASLERFGLEYLATHHQKTIVIDYEGEHPCGYVLGLNSVTDYWDTKEHLFHDPRRGENWEGAKDPNPGLKPYQDYGCRIEGEALAAVCKNFTEAWNKAETRGKGAGANVTRSIDLKAPPRNLTKHLVFPRQGAQILRTLPDEEGSEKSIQRLYQHAPSFARHYLYVENQYFQHAAWVKQLKQQRADHLKGSQKAGLRQADVTKLHVMVVIPTPERKQMVPRTHDTVTELGYGSFMPYQAQRGKDEIATYEAVQKARERDPLVIPPPQMSPITQAYRDAGGGKSDDAVAQELENEHNMRALVASLWTFDPEWSEDRHPVIAQVRAQQANYDRYVARSRAGDTTPVSQVPQPPTAQQKKRVDEANATRYREIYIHSKLMIIDDSMFTLGSANLNLRSFAVDSEINIASDDAATAMDLRKRVWAQHTGEQFDGGVATDQKVIYDMFKKWKEEANRNLKRKKRGEPLTCFLTAFYDDRTSIFRLA